MTVALMWEARAVEGRGEELLAWARTWRPAAEPVRREHFRAEQDRVLVITWWDAAFDADLPELPEPAQELVTRAVHRWRFESADAQHL
ncbi:Antibiotic biosynthesis monooxygenase OS=Streptomyces alboniger OX=132473 GN=CP975_21235 PE=4 SV=1 [Streptomyces alboniger]